MRVFGALCKNTILDSQSVKTTEAGGPRGYDAGKKINGRKRRALVDMDGRALLLEPHPADIQDRDAGGPLLRVSRSLFPFIERLFTDTAYDHERVITATSILVDVVRKLPESNWFCRASTPLGGRALFRVDRPQSQAGKEL